MIKNTFYAWEFIGNELYQYVKKNKFTEINLLFMHEFEINLSQDLINYINKNSIKVNALTCIADKKWLFKNIKSLGIRKDLIAVEVWPTFWILRTNYILNHRNNLYKNYSVGDFKNSFLTFNGRTRRHRTMLIDELAKQKLLDKGIVTYHQMPEKEDSTVWKYHTGEVLISNDNFDSHLSSYDFNETFLESFLHIPTETSTDTFILSEKTAIPMLCGLPFLVLGAPGFHRRLEKMGFKLYTEIFDYSFDLEDNLALRIEKLVENIKVVIDNKHNLKKLYKKIAPKIKHNQKILDEILSSDQYVPEVIKNYYNELIKTKSFKGFDVELTEIFSNFNNYNKISNYKTRFQIFEADLWHDFSYPKIVNFINSNSVENIIIYGENEWCPWVTTEFVDAVNKHNVSVTWITGAPKSKYLDNLVSNFKIFDFQLKHYENFWFNFTATQLESKGINYRILKEYSNFKYPFVCFNNRGHLHRCQAIDLIAKNQLLDRGIVTWHNIHRENSDFKFEYFDNTVRKINDGFEKKLDSFLLPQEYHDSLFDFVTECCHETIMVSEKTITPIILGKPFIVLSAPGFHKYLESLGFMLYDEVFDYSFDLIDNLQARTEGFVNNMANIANIKDYDAVYKTLLPKIEHNYNNFLRLLKDTTNVPEEIHTMFLKVRNNPDAMSGRLRKYYNVLKQIEE